MWKKPILFGVLLALGGAIAYVGAQEGTRPPSILNPHNAEPLTPPAAGNQPANGYPATSAGNSQSPAGNGWSASVSSGNTAQSIRQTGAAFAAANDGDDDVEVPAILRGGKPATSGSAASPTTTPGSVPNSTPPATLPRQVRPLGQVDSQPIPNEEGPASSGSTPATPAAIPNTPVPTNNPFPARTPVPSQTQPGYRLNDGSSLGQPAMNSGPGNSGTGNVGAGAAPATLPTSPSASSLNTPRGPGLSSPRISPSDRMPSDRTEVPQLRQSPAAPQASSVDQFSIQSVGPQLRVLSLGPKTIKVGKPASYRIQLENLSDVAASEVDVTVTLPAWVDIIDASAAQGSIDRPAGEGERQLTWSVIDVPAGTQNNLDLELIVNENRPFDLATSWACAPIASTARVAVTQPQLEMAIVGPQDVVYGEAVTFNISVANPGNGVAENVVIQLPEELGGQRSELGSIAPGGMEAFQVELTPREKGVMSVSATATGDGGLEEVAQHRIQVRRADLVIELQAPQFKFAGTIAEVKLIVQNSGDAEAGAVMAAAALPEGAEYQGGIEGAEAVEGGVRWQVGDLAPGARLQYTLQCVLNQSGENSFEAGVRDSTQLQATDAAKTMVEAVAELVLEVRDPKGPLPVKEAAFYELKIRNRGTKAARNVNLIAQFSEGIEPTEGIGQESVIADGQVVFDPIPLVAAGEEVVVRVKAVANKDGNHIFRAHLTCENPDTHRVFEGTTRYFDASSALHESEKARPSIEPLRTQPASQSSPTTAKPQTASPLTTKPSTAQPSAAKPSSIPSRPASLPPSQPGSLELPSQPRTGTPTLAPPERTGGQG